jgi:hypothetical protein
VTNRTLDIARERPAAGPGVETTADSVPPPGPEEAALDVVVLAPAEARCRARTGDGAFQGCRRDGFPGTRVLPRGRAGGVAPSSRLRAAAAGAAVIVASSAVPGRTSVPARTEERTA